MNWPPPTVDPVPVPETDAERRGLSAVPAAAWIGLLGGALLLVAAVAVVASNWNTIGESVRVAGLAGVTVGLLIAARRLRPMAPTTAGIVAHVGTLLTASVGISALSVVGVTWPGCLLLGGVTLIVATELQATRRRRATMHLAQIAGWATAATGAAALLGTTAGLLAALAATGLLVVGAHRRSAMLAGLAVVSPALTALADTGIGNGTLQRAGLVGERLGWSGPAVGLLAATVIGAIAWRRRSNPLMLVAVACPVIGLVTGFAAADGSFVAWWSVPAMALIAAELGLLLLPTDRWRGQIADLVDIGAVTVAVGAWTAPAIARLDIGGTDLASPWAIPVALTGLGVGLSLLRWRSSRPRLADLGVASVAGALLGLVVAFDPPDLAVAGAATVAVLFAVVLSRRLSPLALHPAGIWALISIGAVGSDTGLATGAIAFAFLAATVAIVVAARGRLAADHRVVGGLEMGAIAIGVALGALALTDRFAPAIGLGVIAGVMLLVVIVERRHTVAAVATVACTSVVALDAATAAGTLDTSYWAGWAAATAAFTIAWSVHRSAVMAHAAAGAAVVTVAASAAPLDVPLGDVVVMAMLAVVALTGLAGTIGRRTALDAAAGAAGVVLLTTTLFGLDPPWIAAAWFVLGIQMSLGGVAFERRPMLWSGLATAVGGAIGWWFTSGAHVWFTDLIAPADIRVADLWLAAITVASVLVGRALRAEFGVSSWVAYTAALVIPGLWLPAAHLDRDPVWVLPLLLTLGVVAAGLGAWHRLAAPLVGGTVLCGIATVLATGSDLTAIPTWVWLALGGGSLIATAVLIERAGRPDAPDLRELVARWQ
ncbi:MAG: hypothetical protein R8G01_04690 [Ilumatobacteraceae bacterium]|nr:hypothetical protein [Ilumatobacteraceae bacterium]